jgi:hypothetical protein
MQQVTLWLHVSTVNGHRQADKEHLVKVEKGRDYLYRKENILYWPGDDRLLSKHVATI